MSAKLISESERPACVIVGTGSIGKRHLQVLKASGEINVFAFPIRPQSRPELKANNFHVLENWDQVRELGIGCAIIATDTGRHPTDIQFALDAGCSVLVEKPLAVDAASAFLKLQEAKRLERGLWVGCSLRFQASLNTFRDQLRLIGKIHAVRIECQSYLPEWRPQRSYKDSYSARSDEGGVLRDLIHEIDYALWLYGLPKAITANIRSTGALGIPAEDAADILWETHNAGSVSITLDYLSRPAHRQMRTHGELGTLTWDGISGQVILMPAGGQPHTITSTQTRDEMYLAQDLAFIQASSGSHNERLATGADGVRALAVCDAARLASKKKSETEVDYLTE